MRQVNVHDAKTHLSKLIEDVEAGEEIVIARAGRPAVKLTAIGSPGIKLGLLRGVLVVPDDFTDPLPENPLSNGAEPA